MKLIYFPAACSLADHIALIETKLAYDLVSIDHGKKTADGRDFLAINPKGYIPALELDDGTILTENQVILAYIAEASGRLLPEGIGRWRVLEALAFMSSEIHPAYLPFFKDFPEVEKARARQKLAKSFAILEDQLGDQPFLFGDQLTIADCYLFWVLMVAPRSGVTLPERLNRYFARLKLRPSVVRAFAEEGLAL
ncbi:glutathione S-transferase C-terminal domain-containing protein [Kaistia dalseonensis]|uniref:Glutathione S-transferase n=1 Tax=Kaistia dalseonensis TaxID=410840 RepID=A0ABU0H4I5_9HYPH|nr:glutathione S-transferase C-terminal domain-containing protein [Kaistia dalseonensis]MCX5494647.1 glutathione S-transferase C-terminal domain-containing protein [Kaistia dalseonensis]MDQ0437227.1 glutathione S-transferase [Kaistia dalseonensis]